MKKQRKKRTIVTNQRINSGRNIMENQTAYLKSLMETNQRWQSLESYAAMNQVPIMDEVSMDFVCQLVNIQQPTNILEIGTAIGYSAIRMASKAPSKIGRAHV